MNFVARVGRARSHQAFFGTQPRLPLRCGNSPAVAASAARTTSAAVAIGQRSLARSPTVLLGRSGAKHACSSWGFARAGRLPPSLQRGSCVVPPCASWANKGGRGVGAGNRALSSFLPRGGRYSDSMVVYGVVGVSASHSQESETRDDEVETRPRPVSRTPPVYYLLPSYDSCNIMYISSHSSPVGFRNVPRARAPLFRIPTKIILLVFLAPHDLRTSKMCITPLACVTRPCPPKKLVVLTWTTAAKVDYGMQRHPCFFHASSVGCIANRVLHKLPPVDRGLYCSYWKVSLQVLLREARGKRMLDGKHKNAILWTLAFNSASCSVLISLPTVPFVTTIGVPGR